MRPWPQIEDGRTLRRFAASDSEFAALAARLAERIGGQTFADEHLTRAIGYPWHAPAASRGFLLRDEDVEPLDALADRDLVRISATRTKSGQAIHPLVAFGSNAAPETLRAKLAKLTEPEDRQVLAIGGELSDLAIGHSPHLAVYGSLPATIFQHPGARASVTLLMVTDKQLAALSATEFNYLLARFPGERFDGALPTAPERPIHAFVSRHGVIVDQQGNAQELAAPSQRELLDRAARTVLGEAASAIDLVRRTIESYAWAVNDAKPRLASIARPLNRSDWELHPGR